jgi:hypothetical protein
LNSNSKIPEDQRHEKEKSYQECCNQALEGERLPWRSQVDDLRRRNNVAHDYLHTIWPGSQPPQRMVTARIRRETTTPRAIVVMAMLQGRLCDTAVEHPCGHVLGTLVTVARPATSVKGTVPDSTGSQEDRGF